MAAGSFIRHKTQFLSSLKLSSGLFQQNSRIPKLYHKFPMVRDQKPWPQLKTAGGPILIGSQKLLIQQIRTYSHIREPSPSSSTNQKLTNQLINRYLLINRYGRINAVNSKRTTGYDS